MEPNRVQSSQVALEEVLSIEDSLSTYLDHDKVREIIGRRIDNGDNFWNKELDLKNVREINEKRYNNQNFEVGNNSLYDWNVEYRDNRLFVSVETLASSIVSKIPEPEVIEAFDTDASRELAVGYGKVLSRRAEDIDLKGKLRQVAKDLLKGERVAYLKTVWDYQQGRTNEEGDHIGDVDVLYVEPWRITLDEEATNPNDVPLIAEAMEETVESLGYKFPNKKDVLMRTLGREKSGNVGMATKIGYKEVWFSFLDPNGVKREGLAWKYKNILFEYGLNPNYIYEGERTNYLDAPKKPYTIFNFLRGKWAIDSTSLMEQAASQQDILEKRGRQIVENADQAVAARVFNIQQVNARDAEKYTGDPRKNILVKGDARTAYNRVPAPSLPSYVLQDKYDARSEIDNIFGTHAPLRGEKTDAPTLGQEVLSQRSDLGRTSTLVEEVEKGGSKVYHQMTQMYKVFGDEEHVVKYVGEDGQTIFNSFSNDKIEDGIQIRVRPGSMIPDDKLADKQEAIELAKIGGRIDPLTFFEKWHVDKPRESAKRLFQFLFMPDQYAQSVLNMSGGGDPKAQQNMQRLVQGQPIPPEQNASKEYLSTMDAFLNSPSFQQLQPQIQNIVKEHVQGTIEFTRGGLREESPREKKENRLFALMKRVPGLDREKTEQEEEYQG